MIGGAMYAIYFAVYCDHTACGERTKLFSGDVQGVPQRGMRIDACRAAAARAYLT
jgi:hypothetical protein